MTSNRPPTFTEWLLAVLALTLIALLAVAAWELAAVAMEEM